MPGYQIDGLGETEDTISAMTGEDRATVLSNEYMRRPHE
jgi:hypothetical protein